MTISLKNKNKWTFKNIDGDFTWENPAPIHELYMPLCNEKGMMSSINPYLNGDIKIGNDYFLTQPVSIEDLHNTKSARNFWCHVSGKGPWSATGNSAIQNSKIFDNHSCKRIVEAGLLWHNITLQDEEFELKSSILNFVASEDNVEIMMVTIENISENDIDITPTSSIPIFARSSDNLRDHRHVTSLLNRVLLHSNGIFVKPMIQFDEKGHKYNNIIYYVLGADEEGAPPAGTIPLTKNFLGEQGTFDWPETIIKNIKPENFELNQADGKEYVGALQFARATLGPSESKTYILLIGISNSLNESNDVFEKFNTKDKVLWELEKVKSIWNKKADTVKFECAPDNFSTWMRWVCIQPTLRKIFGNSFLPYHDYGKGGRGWRDIWQDALTLIIQNPEETRDLLVKNISGVRIDGTNATIICNDEETFISDRNKIPRVWMDHGAWPFLTIKLFIDQTGDLEILLQKANYFQDTFRKRSADKDITWKETNGYKLLTKNEEVYQGSLIEHLLVQHLTSFYNVGEHNIILLENADWNDGIDMAMNRGESIAFSALYASNILGIAQLLNKVKEKLNINSIEIFEELQMLFDTKENKHDYSSVDYKKNLLEEYLALTCNSITGKKINIPIDIVINDLLFKAESMYNLIRHNEWVSINEDSGFFKSYYDDKGREVDRYTDEDIRLQLIGQVFTIMSRIATDEQVKSAYNSTYKYLKDPFHGGYRLNSEIKNDIMNLGRFLAFSYGDKENGATFSHMVVMYMNALYKRGFVKEGHEVFQSLYNLCTDVENSKIYPGIPEYFNAEKKGLYPYLTGSASWLVLTFLQEIFGVKGIYGDLLIEPKLMADQFDKNREATVSSIFHNRKIKVIYHNEGLLDFGEYKIISFQLNSQYLKSVTFNNNSLLIHKDIFIDNSNKEDVNIIFIKLGPLND